MTESLTRVAWHGLCRTPVTFSNVPVMPLIYGCMYILRLTWHMCHMQSVCGIMIDQHFILSRGKEGERIYSIGCELCFMVNSHTSSTTKTNFFLLLWLNSHMPPSNFWVKCFFCFVFKAPMLPKICVIVKLHQYCR